MYISVAFKQNELKTFLGILFLIIPLIPLEGLVFVTPSVYRLVYYYWLVIDIIVVFLQWVMCLIKRKSVGKSLLVIFLMALYNITLTYINGGYLRGAIGVWAYTLPILMLVEIYKNRINKLLKVILFYLELLIVVELLLIIIFPNGFHLSSEIIYEGTIWLFGSKSSLQYYVFPAVIVALLFSCYNNRYKNTFFILTISNIVCIAEANSMLFVGLLLMDIIILTKLYQKDIVTKMNIIIGSISVILGNIIVVFYTEFFLSLSYVQYFILSVLGKSPTFSLRTWNWARVWPAIKENPIIGYGYTSAAERAVMYERTTAHAHNLFLELLYEGGMIELSLFTFFCYLVTKTLYKNSDKLSSKVIFSFMLIFFIMYIFENVFRTSSSLIWMLFTLGFYSNVVDSILKKN